MLRKTFEKATKEDLLKVVQQIETNPKWSGWTKQNYKVVLKRFYRWLKGIERRGIYPDEVAWIVTTLREKREFPEEVLTEAEIQKLAEAAMNPRDKAIVLTLYESGCRIGEFLNLRIKHIRQDEYGAVIVVFGKTGARRIRLIMSAPALFNWLNTHPDKGNRDAWVWVSLVKRGKAYPPLEHKAIYKMLNQLAKRAGIDKPVNPHAFRHARATFLAKHLTEAQMKEFFGWTQGSKMASIYVHLSGRDIDNALLSLYGISEKVKAEEKLEVKICPRCKEKNDPTMKFCGKCGLVLDIEVAREIEERRRIIDKWMEYMMRDPKVLQVMIERTERLLSRKLPRDFKEKFVRMLSEAS
jgi:integrase